MPIYEAIYRYEDMDEPILVSNIEQHEHFTNVKKNLFCTYNGCPSKLSYVPRGKVRAHFKTWPKANHTKDCIDFFERMEKANKQKNVATSTMMLSDKHIKSVLDNLKKRRKEQEAGTPPKTNINKKPRPKVKPNALENPSLTIVPTTGAGADLTSGQNNIKEPPVRNRSIINLTDDDIGTTRSIEGYIQNVLLEENRVVIDIQENSDIFKVYFEQFFFNNAPVNFSGLFVTLKSLVDKNKRLLFSGVGLIETRNEEYVMLINKNNDFYVEYKYFTVFIHSASI
ncbi:hypothetical protein [Paenibacillus agilis]|uniref:Uncharacterized protein n=1 Tax=Paenibacillus agilis TaxID=3020863 RepID=A0A559IYC7_9BACL|nr:hypothetical protein [Paenibacillus agilis]TVX92626.1 hypothetical protein FPZ44_05935 [Paenibacillus agilis]